MVLEEIHKRANYRTLHFNNTPLVLYNSHRCIVPVLWQAANEKLIRAPSTLVYFDQHSDALPVHERALNRIKEILSRQPQLEDIFNLSEFYLSSNNDNWLSALMELNLIGDAIWIGHNDSSSWHQDYTDHQGTIHKLYNILSLEGIFSYQGELSDLARKEELQSLWKTLGWEYSEGYFSMKEDEPILLDLDLDYFSFRWRSITKAWLPEFFHSEFLEPNWYHTTEGWTGQRLVRTLIKRAPLITIAREPIHCGGELEVNTILRELNRTIFDDCLRW